MTFLLVNRVRESTISPGTGTATLAGAALGYQTFSVGVGANNTTYYVIADQSGANWEVGYGTVGAGGTTLARTTVLSSSNGGSLVNFSSGTQDVWVDYPATKAVYLDSSGNASALGTVASATLTNATGLPVSTGISGLGTGVATWLATPSSANLLAAMTDETGTGSLVFANTPTLITPNIGAATGTSLSVTGSLTSTVATGTAPLSVASTTLVSNLNVQYLNGQLGSYYTTAGNLTGTIPSAVLGNSTLYVGTTAITLNRASANLALTGLLSGTFQGSTSGSVQLIPAAIAGTGTVLTMPATTGTIITSGDSGTVTNTMLAGSIANAKLLNSSVTFNGVAVALGASGTITATATNALTIGTGLSGTSYNGSTAVTIANTGILSITGTAPVSASTTSGATTISMAAANTTTNGYLTSTDWNTFNNKQPAGAYLTAVTADAPLSGSGTSGSHLVIATANTTTTGALSSTDWNTFNGKQAALVSGTNIKTVGGNSLLGSGDVGVIGYAYGGTGLSAVPTNGQLNIGNGSGFTRATLSASSGISITNGAGSITINNTIIYSASYLVVAGGGGGGGGIAAGGGAGGFLAGSTTLTLGSTYAVTVGGGGTGGVGNANGTTGGNSALGSITAIGGGYGGGYPNAGGNGGSGGGGAYPSQAAGSGTSGQGNAGGAGGGGGNRGGGGGGGAGAAGSANTGAGGAAGGNGSASSITGSSVTYAGGGGGGSDSGATGTGGTGGGGNGISGTGGTGGAGTANTGGGGGGGGNSGNGGNGGSGIVILSVPTANYTGSTTGSPTITTSGANTIMKFTASGSYIA